MRHTTGPCVPIEDVGEELALKWVRARPGRTNQATMAITTTADREGTRDSSPNVTRNPPRQVPVRRSLERDRQDASDVGTGLRGAVDRYRGQPDQRRGARRWTAEAPRSRRNCAKAAAATRADATKIAYGMFPNPRPPIVQR